MTKNVRTPAPRALRAAMPARGDSLVDVFPDFVPTAFAARTASRKTCLAAASR
jgi:hypothetical protein